MAGDTLRGIGKKQIAEALEAASAAERASEGTSERTSDLASESNGTTAVPMAAVDLEARPERSLDELPSERTGYPVNHSGNHDAAGTSISDATTLVQDAPAAMPTTSAATLVDDAVPLASSTTTPRSGPNRVSFGTMIGHEVHAVQARVAASAADGDAALRGTAHGRDVHLPAHPAMTVEPETAPAAASVPQIAAPAPHAEPASTSASNFAPARDSLNEFSGGDHSFFETAPVNDEYEPENPRGRLYTRLAVSGAVVAVVSVVVVAWVNSHGSSEERPPMTAPGHTAVAAPAPTPPRPPAPPARAQEEPPTSTIPSSVPERIAVTTAPPRPATAPPRPATAPSVAPAPPAPAPKPAPVAAAPPDKPALIAAPAPKPAPVAAAPAPVRELRTPPPPPQPPKKPTTVATAAPKPAPVAAVHAPAPPPARAPAPPPPPPAARPAPPPVAKASRPESAPSRPVAKATPARASKPAPARGKTKYDPDGTLPLSFE